MSSLGRLDIDNVLLATLVTEKTSASGERENSVVFWVDPRSTKPLIKRAVEKYFPEAKVEAVRTLVQGRENVQRGGQSGRTKKRKKAFVKLVAGHEINLAEFE
jgi:large subunit ribosomal protein L23